MQRRRRRTSGTGYPGLAEGLVLLALFALGKLVAFTLSRHLAAAGSWLHWLILALGDLAGLALVLVVARSWLPIPLWEAVFLTRRPCARGTAMTLALAALLLPTSWGLQSLTVDCFQVSAEKLKELNASWQADGVAAIVLSFLFGAIVAPIAEEILFRGVLLRSFLRRNSRATAIVLSSTLFALVHHPLKWAATLLFAVVLAWWVARTHVLIYGCLVHMLNNGVSDLVPPVPFPISAALLITGCGSLALALFLCYLVRSPATPRAPTEARGGDSYRRLRRDRAARPVQG